MNVSTTNILPAQEASPGDATPTKPNTYDQTRLNGSTNFSTGAIYAKRSLVNFGSSNILTSGQLVIGKIALNSGGKVLRLMMQRNFPKQ